MCFNSKSAQLSVLAQERMFRLAERDHDLSLRTLALESGIPLRTLQNWKAGAVMPAWALFALGKAGVPDHLTSLVGNAFGKHVGTDHIEDGGLHEAATEAIGFGHEYLNAASADSEGGPIITPRERAKLGERAMRAAGKLRAVAA
jgi:hypothetical protein